MPLCPAIAERSYSEGRGKLINRFAVEAIELRSIEVIALSSYIAEFSGFTTNIDWLEKNYQYMVCGFDPRQITDDREAYISCMRHAPTWIRVVQSRAPEELLHNETYFRENCAALGP